MFAEDDLLPLSALQHLVFCERQWALIHLEQVWEENRLTVEGRHLHERVDEPQTESRGDVRTARAVPLRSLRLGLTGRADVVEFHRCGEEGTWESGAFPSVGMRLPGASGRWRPFPVEYKRGRPKPDRCDEVQLCAQALCLEEMMGVPVPAGALFYGQPRRRHEVKFDPELRGLTESLAARLHELTRIGRTPPAAYGPRCESCSLIGVCLPKAVDARRSASEYLRRAVADSLTEDGEGEEETGAP